MAVKKKLKVPKTISEIGDDSEEALKSPWSFKAFAEDAWQKLSDPRWSNLTFRLFVFFVLVLHLDFFFGVAEKWNVVDYLLGTPLVKKHISPLAGVMNEPSGQRIMTAAAWTAVSMSIYTACTFLMIGYSYLMSWSERFTSKDQALRRAIFRQDEAVKDLEKLKEVNRGELLEKDLQIEALVKKLKGMDYLCRKGIQGYDESMVDEALKEALTKERGFKFIVKNFGEKFGRDIAFSAARRRASEINAMREEHDHEMDRKAYDNQHAEDSIREELAQEEADDMLGDAIDVMIKEPSKNDK